MKWCHIYVHGRSLHSFPIGRRWMPSCALQLTAEPPDDTEYFFLFSDEYVPTGTGRGVRQGCRSAPLLWCCNANLLFLRLAHRFGEDWVKQTITLFADDMRHGAIFHSKAQLREALWRIGILLDELEAMGLTISYTKSVLIISISGTSSRKTRQRYIQQRPSWPLCEHP